MDVIIESFHIDLRLLIAQAVNFAIVFSVLYFFALKPLFSLMKQRTEKIEKSLDDARQIEKKLSQTEADYQAEIARAKKEAGEIMAKAAQAAEEKKKEILLLAREEMKRVVSEEREKIDGEREKAFNEAKKELGSLVATAVEKVLAEKLSKNDDESFIKKTLESLK